MASSGESRAGPAERVAVELLVDVDVAVLGRAVDGVAAAAEVDEVQQVEALLELLRREPEPALELVGLDVGGGRVAAAGEQEGQERLEEREPLGRDGPWRTRRRRAGLRVLGDGRGRRHRAGLSGVGVHDRPQVGGHRLDDRVGLDGVGVPAEREDPRRERREVGVGRREPGRAVGQLLDLAVCAVAALDEPRGVGAHLDHGRPGLLGRELPRRPVAVGGHVEVGRNAEVALAAGRELDLAADARDAERAPAVVVGVAVEVVADDVPDAVHLPQAVRVDGPLGLVVGGDRPVPEPHGALLRDGLLELRQAGRDLVGVERGEQLDRGRLGPGVGARPGPAEREVLEGEAQRLGVRELPLEQVKAGLERRQLVVGELDRREEVLLLAEAVELLRGELVAARRDRNSQILELAAVGVVAAREGLVAHVGIPLDVGLHVARRDGSLFRHEVRHERELADELVGVVGQDQP